VEDDPARPRRVDALTPRSRLLRAARVAAAASGRHRCGRRITLSVVRNPIRLKNLRPRFLPFYLVAGVLLFAVRPEPATYLAGLALVAIGALLRGWGAGHLVKSERLTLTGPYAWMRHPLYAGTLLVGVGFALMPGGWPSLAMLTVFLLWYLLGYFPRKERSEAARLEALHGRAFEDYRAQVPALLPRLRAWRPQAAGCAADRQRWSLDRYSENNELGTLLGLIALSLGFGLRTWLCV
jgi:protein-S-isoprenylcysteine O-methyltransferase Ste14